jgi:porin
MATGRKRFALSVGLLVVFLALGVPTGPQAAEKEQRAAAQEVRLVPWVDYTGDLWRRPALTGDWGGTRQTLMDKGVRFDLSIIQTLQGNWAGGTADKSPYQMNARYGIQLDTGKAGLWPGGMLVLKGESKYGNSNNGNTGGLMPVNTLSLYPAPQDDITTLSDLYAVQFLAEWVGLLAGKMTLKETNVFASKDDEQFLNAAFNFNLAPATTVPLNALVAGVILLPTKWLTITTMAIDSEGTATRSGFDTAFKRGTTVFQNWEFTIKPFGLPGHQRLGWSWSDKSRIQFGQTPRAIIGAIITDDTSGLARKDSDWSFVYDFDQYLYMVPGKADQGFGLFGRIGLTDGEVNPIQQFYSIGFGGKGLIPGRDRDSFGIGYYYVVLSDKLPQLIQNRSRDEQGVELYYNIAVTPWFHVTPDLQIISPARKSVDTTVVAGLRVKIDF